MAQTVPPFVQYQEPMFPLRGLWNTPPVEGDRFVNVSLQWGTLKQPAVQLALSGNSPVAMSQIIALAVDNSRCGSDIDFLFPDSGFVLNVPAHNAGVYPVFTNALMFYAIARAAGGNDMTVFQICNSMPPPISILPSEEQNSVSSTGIPLTQGSNAYFQQVPAGTTGLLTGFSIAWGEGAQNDTANFSIIDGTSGAGRTLWSGTISSQNGSLGSPPNMNVRFFNGLTFAILGSDYNAGTVFVNLYYTTP